MATIKQVIHRFRRYIALLVAFPVIVLALFALLLVWQVFSLLSAANLVDLSDKAVSQENYVLKLLIDEETGQRGYLVGGDKQFLQPYTRAQADIGRALDTLSTLLVADGDGTGRMAELLRLRSLWLQEAAYEVRLRDINPNTSTFRDYFNKAHGKALMDAMRLQLSEMNATTERHRDLRTDRVQRAALTTVVSVLGGAIVLGLILGLSTLSQIRRLSSEYEAVLRSEQKNSELLSTTLLSIGDAVLVTDAHASIMQLNAVAELLTGWKTAEAFGRPASEVFKIYNETTRARVDSPIERVIREGIIVGLANHTVLVHRDGHDVPIDDSGAPIRDGDGTLIGTVLVFRDISERRRLETQLEAQYQKEHRIAESLQRSLLSKHALNGFSSLEIEPFYRPALNEAQVGGDFFDVFALEDGKIAIAVGDVSGKGLEAASKTAEIKYTLRAYLREHPHPASAMTRLNEFLCEAQALSDEAASYFLCLSLAVVDTAAGNLAIGTAGSEPPLIVRNKLGTVEVGGVAASGIPLGVMPRFEYESANYTMEHADILVIATDGITEARRSPSEMLGVDGLVQIIRTFNGDGPLSDMGEGILAEATSYAGGALKDDVCIVIARRL